MELKGGDNNTLTKEKTTEDIDVLFGGFPLAGI